MIYMEARNSLAGNAGLDIAELKRVDIPRDCRVLVYQSMRNTAPKLFEIINSREIPLKIYPEETSAVDPEQLRSVIISAREFAPSHEFGLIMWSHSSGWIQSMIKSRGFGLENSSKQMSVSDLADAVENLEIDFILFDTCYMGCVEVAYELRHAARYMAASVCEVNEDGMPYDLTMPALFAEDMVAGLKNAIDITVTYNTAIDPCPATMSLIDLSAMDRLAQAVKSAPGTLPDDYVPQRFSDDTPYSRIFCDFGQYFDAIGGDPMALNAAIIHERHSPTYWGHPLTLCSGLSIYLPECSPGYNYDSYGYSSLEWYKFIHSIN